MQRLSARLRPAGQRPTRIIQFGEGNFLRAFVDWQVQQMNQVGLFDGGVAIVQPLPDGRLSQLEQQDGLYTVILEGIQDDHLVQSHELITVVNQMVNPYENWSAFLALADDPAVRFIVSNTTEAGIAVDPRDDATTVPPRSFPAKLAHLLRRRFENGLPGFVMLPCELIDDNGTKLKQTVAQCVNAFDMGADMQRWIDTENQFCNTLVDRIVPGFPRDQAEQLWSQLGYEDQLLVKAEPFLLWVIQGPEHALDGLPLREAGLNVVLTDDLSPYHDRKVLLLNGPHTSLAQLARLAGLTEVAQAMGHDDFAQFVAAEMRDEMFPALKLPTAELESFASQVIERFKNPYIHHRLDDIALNSASKFVTRLLPVIKAHAAAGRPVPNRVALTLAGLLAIYTGDQPVRPFDMPDVLAAFDAAKGADYVPTILANCDIWGEDLNDVPGLTSLVAQYFAAINSRGVNDLVRELK